MSPGVVLAVLFAAIGAQLTRLLVPGRGNLALALAAACLGLLGAELVAFAGHGGPALGSVHPVADVLGIAAAEAIGLALVHPPRPGGR